MTDKECKSCGKVKLATTAYFTKDSRKKLGIGNECKTCVASRAKAKRKGITCLHGWFSDEWKCNTCSTIKTLNIHNFFPVKGRITGFDVICRDCRNVYHRKHKSRYNTDEKRQYAREQSNRRHREAKVQFIEYKGSKCQTCSIPYDGSNAMIFDFHHRDPQTKEFEILKRGNLFKTNQAELDKCDLLCANCHRQIHSETY